MTDNAPRFVSVPVEPTEEMWIAAEKCIPSALDGLNQKLYLAIYKAMIAAAPTEPKGVDAILREAVANYDRNPYWNTPTKKPREEWNSFDVIIDFCRQYLAARGLINASPEATWKPTKEEAAGIVRILGDGNMSMQPENECPAEVTDILSLYHHFRSLLGNGDGVAEKWGVCHSVIHRLYRYGLIKFPAANPEDAVEGLKEAVAHYETQEYAAFCTEPTHLRALLKAARILDRQGGK